MIPEVTFYFFKWYETASCLYISLLGVLVLPCHFMVGYLSSNAQTFLGVIFLQVLLVLGIMSLFQYPFKESESHTFGFGGSIRYIFCGMLYFVFVQLSRGFNMSVLHDIVKISVSNTFTGLFVMILPILGSVFGCILVAVSQMSKSIEPTMNNMLLCFAITQALLCSMGIGLIRSFYHGQVRDNNIL